MELISYKVEESIPELADTFRAKVDIVEEAVRQGADFLRRGVDQGVIRDDLDPMDMSWAWQAFREGVTRMWLMNPDTFSLIEKAPTLVDLYLRGILAKPK
jgi:hypothetical protein